MPAEPPPETDPYDTTEAVQILITDRARRYSQDFLEAREVAALALRDAVMKSAAEAGYRVAMTDGHHEIAPREGAAAVVALLANADGVRVARLEGGRLTDETAADIHYDAARNAWISGGATNESNDAKKAMHPKESKDAAPERERSRSPVAVVAELVVAALQKIP